MMQVNAISVERRGRRILDAVSLDLRPGELLAIVGPNGAGKTTLLGAMAGDLGPSDGAVSLDGRLLRHWTPLDLARRRAVMPQASKLGFSLPVQEVVALGRAPYRQIHDRHIHAAAIERAIALADIGHLARRAYATLSGGEQQRVQLARAIAQLNLEDAAAAPLLLLDEPTASLDLAHAHAVLKVSRDLAGRGVAVAAVLHDLPLAYRYAAQVAVLQGGRLQALGPPQAVLTPDLLRRVFAVEAAIYDGYLVVQGPLAA
jgi:iron complex transport system ATP-binding protein